MKTIHFTRPKTLLLGLLVAPLVLLSPAAAFAQATTTTTTPTTTTTTSNTSGGVTQGPVSCGVELTLGSNCPVDGTQGEEKILDIIKQIINVASLLVGAICILMIIFGGFRYMISGGDSGGVTTAKNTILYAVVGLVVVLLSQALVRFVFTRTTSA